MQSAVVVSMWLILVKTIVHILEYTTHQLCKSGRNVSKIIFVIIVAKLNVFSHSFTLFLIWKFPTLTSMHHQILVEKRLSSFSLSCLHS